ncbi:unnamed protein product [Gordionus sp. m RMFG-2023]
MNIQISKEYEMLQYYGEKFNVSSDIIKKAEEILRVYDSQSLTPKSPINFIISLYIASSIKSSSLDKNLAIKTSGLSKNNFNKSLNTFTAIINKTDILKHTATFEKWDQNLLQKLSVKYECTDACILAQNIINKYLLDEKNQKNSVPAIYYTLALSIASKKLDIHFNEKLLTKDINLEKNNLNIQYTLNILQNYCEFLSNTHIKNKKSIENIKKDNAVNNKIDYTDQEKFHDIDNLIVNNMEDSLCLQNNIHNINEEDKILLYDPYYDVYPFKEHYWTKPQISKSEIYTKWKQHYL